ncbi:MAG TPA: NUDIX domain-containing protein [Longimicrobiales bacterium]
MRVIPFEHLPPGFAERIDDPPDPPATPLPAATAVLLRDGGAGPEVLLLRRNRSSGFVPGAYVFPGGRVDAADGEPAALARLEGWEPGGEPAAAYILAAVREVLEETGVLLARDAAGRPAPDARAREVARWRTALLEDRATLADALEALDLRVVAADVVYCAHWITPAAEPRRYDTRFFLARLPAGAEPDVHARELTDALWLSPAEALARFRSGRLPMVFPTVHTLESLAGFRNVEEALAAFRGCIVAPILPRLVRTPEGVAIVVDGQGQGEGAPPLWPGTAHGGAGG